MSILIKGMDMPKGCYDCTMESICNRWALHDAEWQKENRDKDCPLIPVPPHGDLVDRDALAEDGWVLTKQVMRMGGYAIHELPLKNPTIPVIIPAEEGE